MQVQLCLFSCLGTEWELHSHLLMGCYRPQSVQSGKRGLQMLVGIPELVGFDAAGCRCEELLCWWLEERRKVLELRIRKNILKSTRCVLIRLRIGSSFPFTDGVFFHQNIWNRGSWGQTEVLKTKCHIAELYHLIMSQIHEIFESIGEE